MIKKHTCKNGLRVVLETVPSVRSMTIGIWVLAGSRNETTETNGISHFIEHMLFKGTKTRTAQDIAESFDSIGGQVNAFTSKEYTCFYARVLDTHKEHAVEVLSDMFFNSVFDENEIQKEKNVVMEEIKMYEDTPDDIVHDLLAKATYGDHPLGYPILGTEEHLNRFNEETIRTYMNEYYIPENIVISIAGNIDDSILPLIEDHFGSFESNKKQEEITKPVFLMNHMSRNKETEQAHFCLGYNGLPIGDDNSYSLVIINNVLGGSMSSRLFQEIREKRGLAYSVFSYHSSFLDNGLLTIYAGTGRDQLPKLKDTILQTVDNLVAKGLSDKELYNSKEQLKGNLVLSLESTNSRMARNGKNELLLKQHRTLDEMIQKIDSVNQTSIQKTMETTFKQKSSSALISPISIK